MAKKKPKKSKALNPPSDKTPRKLRDPISYDALNFSWRVHNNYIDYDHPEFGWGKVSILLFLQKIIQRLQGYEGLTWHEVKEMRYCHPWGLDEIPRECFRRLEERQIDIEQLYQIGLGNKPRIIGYKDGPIFYLMWWDPEHRFCPTRAK
jgi:hypothetical protein